MKETGTNVGYSHPSRSAWTGETPGSSEDGGPIKRRRLAGVMGAEVARDAAARRRGRQDFLKALAAGKSGIGNDASEGGHDGTRDDEDPTAQVVTMADTDLVQGSTVGIQGDTPGRGHHRARPESAVCDRPEVSLLSAGTCADNVFVRDRHLDRQPLRLCGARRRLRGKQPPLAEPALRPEFDCYGESSPADARRHLAAALGVQAPGGRPPDGAGRPSAELTEGA